MPNQNETRMCVSLYFRQVAIYPKISQNHILCGSGSKICGHFLNNSIQANYNYFVVCVCI